jgi:hypothetical protein
MHIDDVHFLLLYTESLKNNCILSEDYVKLQSRVRTHAILVIGLYELVGNPTT